MPKQVHELPPASSVADTDLTNIKQSLNDRYATIAQILDNIGTAIARATSKATPVDADAFGLSDSADSNVIKKITWAELKAALKTYFESVVFTWALRQVFTIGAKFAASSAAMQFGSGDTATTADFDMDEATTANSIFQVFRNTNTSGARQLIVYKGDGSATVALLFNAATNAFEVGGNTVWHAGNDGVGSGLDADLLDGASTGTAVGNIPVLEDVGGNAGLPAVDGSQLTNLPTGADELVKVSSADTTADYLENKIVGGDGVTITTEDIGGGEERLLVEVDSVEAPRYQLLAVAASDGQTVITFGDPIVDDADSPYNGTLKNHLVFRNGQLLINTAFNDIITPLTGNYSVTNEATGEITLQAGSEAIEDDIFTYIDIRKLTPVA